MKKFKVYLNRTGMINICKGGLKFPPLLVKNPKIESYMEVHSGVEVVNAQQLHELMKNNPEIQVKNKMLVDSNGNIYGGVVIN